MMVVLFAEIESLRLRVKQTEIEIETVRRSSLAPFKVWLLIWCFLQYQDVSIIMRNFSFLAQVMDHFNLRHSSMLVLSVVSFFNFSIGSCQLMKFVSTSVAIFPLVNFNFISILVYPAISIVSFSLTVNPSVKLVKLACVIIVAFNLVFFSIVSPYSFVIRVFYLIFTVSLIVVCGTINLYF